MSRLCLGSSNHFNFSNFFVENVERKSLFKILVNNILNLIKILTELERNSSESISSMNFIRCSFKLLEYNSFIIYAI